MQKKVNMDLYGSDSYLQRDQRTRHAAKTIFDILIMYGIKTESIVDLREWHIFKCCQTII